MSEVLSQPMVWCLVVVALVPWITVVGYETVGHRHSAAVLGRSEPTRAR